MTLEDELLDVLRSQSSDDLDDAVRAFRAIVRRHEGLENARTHIDRPRFLSCASWTHAFGYDAPEFETRWVFDRREWRLVEAEIRSDEREPWRGATAIETDDLEESLVMGNGNVLTGDDVWQECAESAERPLLAATSTVGPVALAYGEPVPQEPQPSEASDG